MTKHLLNFFKPEVKPSSAALVEQGLRSIQTGEKNKDFTLFNRGMGNLIEVSMRKGDPNSEIAFKTVKDIFDSYGLVNFCDGLLPKHLKQLDPPISQRHFDQGRVDQLAIKQSSKSTPIPRP